MNLPTFGMLIKDYDLSQFSISSKIVTLVNRTLGYELITRKFTGSQIVDAYNKLTPKEQTNLYNLRLLGQVETISFYRELSVVNELQNVKDMHNEITVSQTLAVLLIIESACIGLVLFIYRQNTIKNGDYIEGNVLVAVFDIIKYLITSFL